MGFAGVACARWSGACARVVVFVKGVAVMVVVFPEENAREYLHEDDEGDEARSTENFPDSLHSLRATRVCAAVGRPPGGAQS